MDRSIGLGAPASSVISVAARLLVCAALAVTTYALTAASSVPPSAAGDGAGAVSGYEVSAVHYQLAPSDPRVVDALTLRFGSAPVPGSTVRIRLTDSGQWYSCTVSGTGASCLTPGATLTGAAALTIVAAD